VASDNYSARCQVPIEKVSETLELAIDDDGSTLSD